MSKTSATGGYLAPSGSPKVLDDRELDAFLQRILVGLTGIDGTLVRPRWQPVPPNQPAIEENWIAFGITNRAADTFAFELHDPNANEGEGADLVNRNETLDMLCSFYGPNAASNAARVRDGIAVPQNREALLLAGMAFIACGDLVAAPAVINQQWYYRTDMTMRFRRSVTRTYTILHLLTADIELKTDVGLTETIET